MNVEGNRKGLGPRKGAVEVGSLCGWAGDGGKGTGGLGKGKDCA